MSDAINDLNEYEKSITDYQSTHDKSALERANHAFDDLEKITGKMSTAELDAFYDQAHGMNSNGKTMPGTHDLKPENVLGTQGSFYPGHSMDNVKGYSSDPKVQDALKDLNAHNEALATYRKTNDPADLAKLQAAAKKLNQDVDPATMTDKQYHEYFLNALGLGEDGREMSGARDLLPANAGFDGTGANRDKMYPNLARHDALAK